MKRLFIIIVAGVVLLPACATSRKLSQVGLREPSSLEESSTKEEISVNRGRLAAFQKSASPCPQGFAQQIREIALEKIILARCPIRLAAHLQSTINMLLLEERSLLEEIANSQCQSILRAQQEDSLLNLVENFENTGPVGRRRQIIESLRSQQEDFQQLTNLKESLQEVLLVNLPLERWVARNGKFLLPEEETEFLYLVTASQSCRLGEIDFERIYHLQQNLESLERVLVSERQKQILKKFIESLHRITDNKVMEFFYQK